MNDYKLINETMKGIVANCKYPISVMANGAAILFNELTDLNWAGFYLMQDGKLILGPFQGKLACMEIQVGKGVCGTAVATDSVQRVENVHVQITLPPLKFDVKQQSAPVQFLHCGMMLGHINPPYQWRGLADVNFHGCFTLILDITFNGESHAFQIWSAADFQNLLEGDDISAVKEDLKVIMWNLIVLNPAIYQCQILQFWSDAKELSFMEKLNVLLYFLQTFRDEAQLLGRTPGDRTKIKC